MVHPNRPFLRAVGMMVGAIVGAGVFGLPYAFAQSGFAMGLLQLLVLGALLMILQLMMGEVTIQTPGHHRLVNYVGMYVGSRWRWVTLGAMSFAIWGAMLAYMVIGGTFLHLLLSPILGGDLLVYALMVWGVATLLISGGLKLASRIEYWIVGALLFLFAVIILGSLPQISLSHLTTFNPSQAFLPYGVLLFSMAGMGIVPELKDVLGAKHKRELSWVIILGMLVIVSIYGLFSFAVVGVSGTETSMTAFEGLVPYLGDTFRVVASLLGSITILSIFMILGIQLLNTFQFDFHLPHHISWIMVCGVPLVVFVLGVREFIHIVGFVGGVFGGLIGILVALSYWSMRRRGICREHHCINFPAPLTWIIIAIFTLGIAWQLVPVIYPLFV